MPLVSNKISKRALDYTCSEVMVTDVVSVNHSEKVKDLYEKLVNCTHNGFPVINEKKRVIGMISRNHLITIIKNEFFQFEMALSALALQNLGFKRQRTNGPLSINRDDDDDGGFSNLRLSGHIRKSTFEQ